MDFSVSVDYSQRMEEKKYCSSCEQEKNIEDFNWKDKAKGIRRSLCRFCSRAYGREHYKNNKQSYIKRAHNHNIRTYEENKQYLYEYLSTHPCVDCGNTDIRTLEFDHVRGNKSANIASLLSNHTSWSTMEAEISKCEVRCGNCHRIKTLERGNHWRFRGIE